jgi:hypothetical protein
VFAQSNCTGTTIDKINGYRILGNSKHLTSDGKNTSTEFGVTFSIRNISIADHRLAVLRLNINSAFMIGSITRVLLENVSKKQ